MIDYRSDYGGMRTMSPKQFDEQQVENYKLRLNNWRQDIDSKLEQGMIHEIPRDLNYILASDHDDWEKK